MRLKPGSTSFSVIIPTLQRSPHLHRIIEQCAAHPRVGEVIVINNAPEKLTLDTRKTRILQQAQNIYVNPAWNLGAGQAKCELLAIINDDVTFEDSALTHSAAVLEKGFFGIVGPDRSCFSAASSTEPVTHRMAGRIPIGYGTFMCLRRADYVPIPEQMRIWGGDDWIVAQQRRPAAILIRTRFRTDMSTTTRDDEFQKLRSTEQSICDEILIPLHGTRYWHYLADTVTWMRGVRHRVRHVLALPLSLAGSRTSLTPRNKPGVNR